MDTLIYILISAQALGAIVGAVCVVQGELTYIRSIRDGSLDVAERAHLEHIGRGLRYGMLLILLSSFGLSITSYVIYAAIQPALSASYWTLVMLAFLVIGVTWALSSRRISFSLGSAIVFTGWWFLVYLTLGWVSSLSFGAACAFFVVATGLFYAVLEYGRLLALHKS